MQVRGTSSPSVVTLPQVAVGTAAPQGDSSSPPLPPTVAEAFQGLSETVRTQIAAGGLLAADGLPEVIEIDEPADDADAAPPPPADDSTSTPYNDQDPLHAPTPGYACNPHSV